ncbi:MAG: hypothetical protein IJ973_00610, partial [Christensenellaceae bacterium]|nr:hypothetical protein [Christensenellaceae bacterium]
LKHMFKDELKLRRCVPTEPYYFSIAGEVSPERLLEAVNFIDSGDYDPYQLLADDEAPLNGKNDEFSPDDLLRKAFIEDGIDNKFGKIG